MKSNSKSLTLAAAGKTFLIGEYSVLFGGSAIILLTPPPFKLKAEKGNTNLVGIEENSPAYLFFKCHDFSGLSLEFEDPYLKSGGFGASSAQFALLYKLHLRLTGDKFDVGRFLEEYRSLSATKETTILPSGADCVAQYFNHHVFFDAGTNVVRKIDPKFPNLDFAVCKTGRKVITHLHLQSLPPLPTSELQRLTEDAAKSFLNADEELLVKSIRGFFDLLRKQKIIADFTAETADRLLKTDGVAAVKGCGAAGADTILMVFEKRKRDSVLEEARRLGLHNPAPLCSNP
ncbi:MAG: hypothetical protein LBO73_02860 [Holosporaceae bacterium]|jgi:mevalonate kinase|nr:hypothetical protein [Holosporaceae bacterium]